jgi:hypothetical protein
VCAVSLQFKILWRGYTKNKKYWRFHRRPITYWYFTESWKKFTGLCHNHRRPCRRTLTRRYFTESWKTITGLCHNHRWIHRRISPTDSPTYITDGFTDGLCTSRSACISEAQLLTDLPTDRKVWRDFQKKFVRISINYRRYYWWNLMPPITINFCR